MTSQLVGASVWEEGLYEHLTSHEANERELLDQYQRVAAKADSPAFTYLVDMIVDDEKRHHQLFRDLAGALRVDAELRGDQPPVPRLNGWGSDSRLVAELSEQLIDQERQDLKELRRLEHELKEVKDTTLWSLLVKTMQLDTNKHIEILEFIRRHARKRGH
jgi:rubrerythrin